MQLDILIISLFRSGAVADSPSESQILEKIKPVNCEWLLRPKIAVSEFAETLCANFDILADSDADLIDAEKFKQMQTKLSALIDVLKRLDTKCTEAGYATADDIKSMLKGIIGADDETTAFFSEATKLGAAMYQLGIQFTAVQSILCNPDWFAENSVGHSSELKNFKADPTIGGMKRMLTQLCTKDGSKEPATKSAREKRKLTALLDSDDQGETSGTSTQTAKKVKENTKTALTDLESADDDEDTSGSEKRHKKKAKKAKK